MMCYLFPTGTDPSKATLLYCVRYCSDKSFNLNISAANRFLRLFQVLKMQSLAVYDERRVIKWTREILQVSCYSEMCSVPGHNS